MQAQSLKVFFLNDNLLKLPNLLTSLIIILSRFRLGKYTVIADIEQMFHQLKVRESDQDGLRFLWRTTKFENPVACYDCTSFWQK